KVELYVKRPGDASFSLTQTDTPGGTSGSFSYTAAAGDGSYEFYTRAYDNAGNIEAAPAGADTSTLVDTQFPTSSATSPTYSTSTTFMVSYTNSDPLKNGSASGVADVELWAKAPGAGSYSLYATDSGASIDGSFSSTGTVDGSYSFYPRARGKAGNYETAPAGADTSTLVDTQDPNSSITFPVNNTTYNASAWAGGCASSICGSAADPLKDGSASGLAKVEVSIKH